MKRNTLTFVSFLMLMLTLGASDSLRGIFSAIFSSHFALNAAQLGIIVTVSYIGNLVFLLVGGNLIDRYDKKRAILMLTAIWGCAAALFAFTDRYSLLLIGMFFSMGASTLLNTTLNLSTQLLFASSPAFFVNLIFFVQGVGTTASQSLLGRFASDFSSWHSVNRLLLVLGAASALVLAFGAVPEPKHGDAPHPAKRQTSALKNKAAWFLIPVFGFYFVAEHGMMNWFVVYSVQGLGMDAAKAADCLALFFGGIMAGRLLFSPLVDKLGMMRSMRMFSAAACIVYTAGALGGEKTIFLWALSGSLLSVLYPTLVMSIRLYFPAQQVSGAAGTIISAASLFDILFNFGFGALIDAVGYRAGMMVLPAGMVIFTVCFFLFCKCCPERDESGAA